MADGEHPGGYYGKDGDMTKNGSSGPDVGDGAEFKGWPPEGRVPSSLFLAADMSIGARFLYAYLCVYRNRELKAWPSQERMAREVGTSQRSVRRWLAELARHKWIKIHKRLDLNPDWKGNPNARLYEFFYRPIGQRRPAKLDEPLGHRRPNVRPEMATEQLHRTDTQKKRDGTAPAAALDKFSKAQAEAALKYARSRNVDHPQEYAAAVLAKGRRFDVRADPSEYRETLCPECYQANGHAEDCPSR